MSHGSKGSLEHQCTMSLKLNAPTPLSVTHILNDFACGEAILDEWLKRRALTNHLSGASRTFVVTDQEERVYGYYAMAAGAVSLDILPHLGLRPPLAREGGGFLRCYA
jgi:hypothetical protein